MLDYILFQTVLMMINCGKSCEFFVYFTRIHMNCFTAIQRIQYIYFFKFINNLAQVIFRFENKLKLFQKDLRSNNFKHFLYLEKNVS